MTLGDLTHAFNEICTEFFEAKFVDDLFSSFFQLFFVTGNDLPHFKSPFFFGFAQKTAALSNWLSRSSAIVSNDGYTWVHGFTRHDAKMLVLGGVEDALGISEKIFSGLIADGSVKMNIVLDIQFFCQLFKFLLMFDIFRNFRVVSSGHNQFNLIFPLQLLLMFIQKQGEGL